MSAKAVFAVSVFGAWFVTCAAVEPLEASRYKNADGIEVLTSRKTPVAAAPVVAAPTLAKPQPAETRSAASSPIVMVRKIDPELQAERDRDQKSILMQELVNEGRALEQKRQTLRAPRSALDLTADQQQTLREQIARHESNVRSLNSEIMSANRVR